MRKILLNIIMILTFALPTLASIGTVYAAPPNPNACPAAGTSRGQVLNGIGETGNGCDASGVPTLLSTIVNILSIVVGAAAIIMIILAGFKYITSGGEANRVTNAKSTLIYALIGVVVATLAQVLVHYVLGTTNNIVN
jgi:hypothetical protein